MECKSPEFWNFFFSGSFFAAGVLPFLLLLLAMYLRSNTKRQVRVAPTDWIGAIVMIDVAILFEHEYAAQFIEIPFVHTHIVGIHRFAAALLFFAWIVCIRDVERLLALAHNAAVEAKEKELITLRPEDEWLQTKATIWWLGALIVVVTAMVGHFYVYVYCGGTQ